MKPLNYIGFPEVRTAAAGRWEGIHRALGIQLATTSHTKHTPCPGCGGRDRFRLDATYQDTGRWICGGGGDTQAGDGFSLLGHVFGWTPLEQLKAVADYLGLSSANDKERETLRRKAEAMQAKMQEDARRLDEQALRDSNLLMELRELEDQIRHRQYLQRQAHKATSLYRVCITPLEDELSAACAVNTMILESYAHYSAGANQ
ncbi:primase-helicase zinc-binding domain-containing protein [Thiothrix lacustris]|uniref:Primase-helicase zinc-binding domain-containing protein n=1 Tax=Thiothrix lacustris TaxID=525917 RepID=A0ABY9MSI4_9GAMM|nr:primase-helicase zinc-binding domain-containing protein [Thiothrix lacustris]WML91140.1 primase-helicase zinc-binding domain-containing protein [Thiothrix lacustris]